MARATRLRAVLAALVALLAAAAMSSCTGVPTSSRPQTIRSGLGPGQSQLPIRPQRDAGPRDIVNQFLSANGIGADRGFSDERQFLTKQGNQAWSPNTATIVADDRTAGTYDPRTGQVVVTGRPVGTLSASGVYTPTLSGDGSGGPPTEYRYKVGEVNGQFRITSAYRGLLLTTDQFRDTFRQRLLYYFDINDDQLVPVLRYSALTEPAHVAEWLLDQLVASAAPTDVQNYVNTETFPTQARRVHVNISSDDLVRVQIVGAAELSSAGRDLLAAQVSQTLDNVVGSEAIVIEDGTREVTIPSAGGTRFNASMFADLRGPAAPPARVYYLSTLPQQGQIRTANGAGLTGPLAHDVFSSVALARPSSIGQLTVAGVQVTGNTHTLVMGTQSAGIRATSVRGDLSRPTWAPGRAEVWVASGARVYRVTYDGRRAVASAVQVSFPFQVGSVSALRFSPDGSRIAMVLSGARNSGQLYVGPVVRSARAVQVGALVPVSPEDVVVTDVAWKDALTLLAIGDVGSSNSAHIFDTAVDGSHWGAVATTGLPGRPDSVTAAVNAHAWVSAERAVWQQGTSEWSSPGVSGQTGGLAPIYLE